MVLFLTEGNCMLLKERLKSGQNCTGADIQDLAGKRLLNLKLWHITYVHITTLWTSFEQKRLTFISKSAPVSQAETLKSQVDGLTRTIYIEIFQKDVSYEIN